MLLLYHTYAVRFSVCMTDETYFILRSTYIRRQCTLRFKPEWIPGSPGIVRKVYPYPGLFVPQSYRSHRSFRIRVWESYSNVQKFRVRVRKCYRSHKRFRVSWHVWTELTQVPGRYKNAVPVPREFVKTGVQELTEVPCTGMHVVQNVQMFRVRVWMSYRTYRGSL